MITLNIILLIKDVLDIIVKALTVLKLLYWLFKTIYMALRELRGFKIEFLL